MSRICPHDNLLMLCGGFVHMKVCHVDKFLHMTDFFSTGTVVPLVPVTNMRYESCLSFGLSGPFFVLCPLLSFVFAPNLACPLVWLGSKAQRHWQQSGLDKDMPPQSFSCKSPCLLVSFNNHSQKKLLKARNSPDCVEGEIWYKIKLWLCKDGH